MAKRQVVEVCDIYKVIRFALRSDARNQVSRYGQIEKEVDTENMTEIRGEITDRGRTGAFPPVGDLLLGRFGKRKEVQAELQRAVLWRAVDIRICKRFDLDQGFRFAHDEPVLKKRVRLIVIDAGEFAAPLLCHLALDVKKLA